MNTLSTVTLNWYALQHYEKIPEVDQLHLHPKNRNGLYIWGFMDDNDKFWPYYVGKHRNVPFRLCEHLSNLKGGNYTIYDKDNLFTEEDNRLYQPDILADKIKFIRDSFSENQVESVSNMINRFHFTYCIMDNFLEHGGKAEKNILNCFSKKILINTIRGMPCDQVNIGNLFDVINSEWDIRSKK